MSENVNGINTLTGETYLPSDDPQAGGKKSRRFRISTSRDCLRELARIYKSARLGDMAVSDATKYASILQIMVSIIRDTDIENRIKKLEALKKDERLH
ncbi:hypothetical protein [Nitrosomonas sp. ANs5]|uniref:hypothetical protein n=1 Tax=Nitrosomonas sp. ANs5 TaxID=3423941 RepID=UPI003D357D1A